jgi:hypothetical protein
MKLTQLVTGLVAMALMALMVCDVHAQQRRGGGGPQGGFRGGAPGGFRGGPPGGFGRGGDNSLFLLRIEEVQTELEISPQQKEALDKMAEQARGDRPDFNAFREMSEEERRAAFEKMRKEAEERMSEVKAQLEEVLLPQQLDRLEEISLQVRGVQALEDDEVAAKLKITEAQKQKMAEVRETQGEKMRERMREMFQGGGGPGGDFREVFGKLREEMEKEVLAVLDSSQQTQFAEMKGEPFEMPENLGRGPGGPGGGRFRGPGGPGGGPGAQGGPGGRGGRRGGRPQAE